MKEITSPAISLDRAGYVRLSDDDIERIGKYVLSLLQGHLTQEEREVIRADGYGQTCTLCSRINNEHVAVTQLCDGQLLKL